MSPQYDKLQFIDGEDVSALDSDDILAKIGYGARPILLEFGREVKTTKVLSFFLFKKEHEGIVN